MTIVALDTSSAGGSVALIRDGAVVVERVGDAARSHSERLPRELMALLEEGRVTLGGVDRFAVCVGPGSYTGLRIGIATMQGLALAQEKLVTPVSAFEAFRESTRGFGMPAGSATAVWIDAHRGEVFAALYGSDGAITDGPTSLSPEATLDRWAPALADERVRFTGEGALKYRAVIEGRLGGSAEITSAIPPLAGAIGLIAARDPARAVRPHAVVPLYVRRSDVELARDRRQPADRA